MAKYDTEKIVAAVKLAKGVAAGFASVEDGGTCNFDAAILLIPGMRKKQAEEIVKLAGGHYYKRGGMQTYFVGGTEGQGNRRTVMAESQYKTLKAAGFENASMYYQMD